MELGFTKEQQIIKASARNFLKKECPPSMMREMRADPKGFSSNAWKKMAELGWLGINMPEEYEGTGGDFIDLAILVESMGEVCCPGPYFSTVVQGAMAVLWAGSKSWKKKLLPKLASGDIILSMALTEPDMGNGPQGMRTKIESEGDDYILTGTKLFVENAEVCDFLLYVAGDETGRSNRNEPRILLVDPSSPGIHVTPLNTLSYEKQCEVVFDHVRVPKENVLGSEGDVSPMLEKLNEHAVVAKCAELLGIIQAAFGKTVSYAKERKQFGRPIGAFQAIQHHCADMAVAVDGARFMTYQAAWKLSLNQAAGMEASMAKAWTSDAARQVTVLAHQIHGAISFCDEHDIHLYYRKAKAGEIAFGDGNHHLEQVATRLGL